MITFENIRTGEKVTFTGEQEVNARNAHMAAYLNASDLSPNAGIRGQDFGWRLAPEVVAEMESVRQDYDALDRLSRRIGIGIDDISDFHILAYVAERSFAEDAKKARVNQPDTTDLEDDYRARVRAAKKAEPAVTFEPPVVTVTTPEKDKVFEVQTTTSSPNVTITGVKPANGKIEEQTKKEK